MAEVGEHAVRMNEGIGVQEARFCLLCGGEGILLYQNLRDRLFGALGTWALMQCPKCHLVWLNPCPIPEDIGKLYEQYYTHETANHIPKLASVRRTIRDAVLASCIGYDGLSGGLLQRVLGKVLSWIGPIREMVELGVMTLNGQRRGKLLDIGCGNGQFLAKMQELGWDVVGVESDRQALKGAQERFDLSVHEGAIEEVSFPDNTFDAITMNHVIEHVLDPIGTLRECRRVLKPEGKMVVVAPNIESLGHRLFGESCVHLDPPRHLYLFSPRTLRVYTEQVGLKVLQLKTTARSARWMWAVSRLIHRNGVLPEGLLQKQGLWLRLEGLMFQTAEYGLCYVKDVGEELVLIATK